eukprot:COSAG01_NODE_21112_length_917_cov_1.419315_1_plen_24_part_10
MPGTLLTGITHGKPQLGWTPSGRQ